MRHLPEASLLAALAACASPATPTPSPVPAPAQQAPASSAGNADLAMKLANPVAALISVPLQFNHDTDIGPSDGERSLVNVQPVVPITLDEDWNLISRTILPIVATSDLPAPGDDEFGLGDTLQSAFLSPVAPTSGGWIWGVGPALLIPTATESSLGQEQWALGPTAVVLKQDGPWTYGALANHLWSIAGDDARPDVNATFVQPFLAYTTPNAWTFTVNSESTYDWQADDLSVPVNLLASKVFGVRGQLLSLGGGVRYWVEEADNGPEGWGLRVILTFLFPR